MGAIAKALGFGTPPGYKDVDSMESGSKDVEGDTEAPADDEAEVLAMKSFMKATTAEAKASAMRSFLEVCGY